MRRKVISFDAEHGAAINIQSAQDADEVDFATLAAIGPIWTMISGDFILGVAGLGRNAPGYFTGWAVLAADLTLADYGFVTREVRRVLQGTRAHRIDMLVRSDYAAGHRWAVRLGFHSEAVLEARFPDGSDATLYAMIRREFLA